MSVEFDLGREMETIASDGHLAVEPTLINDGDIGARERARVPVNRL